MNKDTTTTEREQYHLMKLPRDTSRLEKLGQKTILPKGYDINTQGQVPKYCYLVISGSVMSYELTYNGDIRSYNYMVPGSLFLEDCLLLDKPCPVVFRTMEPTTLLKIYKCDLKRAFKQDSDVVMDICVSMADKFTAAMDLLRLEPIMPAEWKICRLLLSFADYHGNNSTGRIKIQEKIRQSDIAELLGMNRITVTRNLKLLEEKGYISFRASVFLLKNTFLACNSKLPSPNDHRSSDQPSIQHNRN